MARPKRIDGEKTAFERLEDAFWEMLAEMPYPKITGKEICIRAQVSHNSFYYYFDNVDDMAQKLFDRLVAPVPPAIMLSALNADVSIIESAEKIPDKEKSLSRMVLFANSGSPELTNLAKHAVIKAWLQALDIDEKDLSSEDQLDITFIFGGVFALLSSDMILPVPEVLSAFSEREVGQGVLKKIKKLAQKRD